MTVSKLSFRPLGLSRLDCEATSPSGHENVAMRGEAPVSAFERPNKRPLELSGERPVFARVHIPENPALRRELTQRLGRAANRPANESPRSAPSVDNTVLQMEVQQLQLQLQRLEALRESRGTGSSVTTPLRVDRGNVYKNHPAVDSSRETKGVDARPRAPTPTPSNGASPSDAVATNSVAPASVDANTEAAQALADDNAAVAENAANEAAAQALAEDNAAVAEAAANEAAAAAPAAVSTDNDAADNGPGDAAGNSATAGESDNGPGDAAGDSGGGGGDSGGDSAGGAY